MRFFDKILNRNNGGKQKEENIDYSEHYNFKRQYGPGITNINVYRKLNENGEPLFYNIQMGDQIYNLPIYMISGAPEIQGINGQLPEIYMYINPEMVRTEISYRYALESLLQPDRISQAYRDNCGYLGGIDNNCEIIEADSQFVQILKSLGLDKKDYVTNYCNEMQKMQAQKEEANDVIRGKITKEGQDFGFGNGTVGLNANEGPEELE